MRMQGIENSRVVTIIKPSGLCISDFLEDAVSEKPYSDKREREMLDESAERIRELIVETAEEFELKVALYEYDMPMAEEVPSRRARKWIRESNCIASIDPSNGQMAYIAGCMHSNPVLSAMLAFTDGDILLESETSKVLDTQKTVVFERKEKTVLRRLYAGVLQWEKEDKLKPLIEKMMRFPFGPTFPISPPTSALF